MRGSDIQKELKHVSDLVLFAHIVQSGGISRCAEALGMERTTVSRRLKYLEDSLGTQLVIRSPRQMRTTEAGRRCFETCISLLEIVKRVGDAVTNHDGQDNPSQIVVGAPPEVVDCCLQPKLADFEKANPETEIRRLLVSSSAQQIDFSAMDLLVTWESEARINCHVRELAAVRQSIYASPSYLETYGYPSHPDALRNIPCIVGTPLKDNETWQFSHRGGRHRIKVNCGFGAPTLLESREAAIAGIGCCQLPDYLGEPFVRYGRLLKILPQFRTNDRQLVTATPDIGTPRPGTTLLRLFLEERFSERPHSEQPQEPAAAIVAAQKAELVS